MDLILSGKKTWELRGTSCKIRGRIELAVSGARFVGKKIIGKVLGRCDVVGCRKLKRKQLESTRRKHRASPGDVKYRNIYAWVLKNAKPYSKWKEYVKPNGAITWVSLKGMQWRKHKWRKVRTSKVRKYKKARKTPMRCTGKRPKRC